MQSILTNTLTACVILWLAACRDQKPDEPPQERQEVLELVRGWTAVMPYHRDAYSYSFDHLREEGWETILIQRVEPGNGDAVEITFVPGVDPEREIIYAIPYFRSVYRVPNKLEGKLSWEGIKPLGEGGFQLMTLDTGIEPQPCIRIRFYQTETEQERSTNRLPDSVPKAK